MLFNRLFVEIYTLVVPFFSYHYEIQKNHGTFAHKFLLDS